MASKMENEDRPDFTEWVILEIMGHKKVAGLLSEAIIAGSPFLRIDIPGDDNEFRATQYYRPDAVYCISPVEEEVARRLGRRLVEIDPPVRRYELPPVEERETAEE